MEIIQYATYAKYLAPRPRDFHKGRAGRVLVIGGELGFSGAPLMAACAALRVGAGLVTIATRPEHASLLNVMHPEVMCNGVAASEALEGLLQKARVLIVGPGLGQTVWSRSMLNTALAAGLPTILDADGLNLLAQSQTVVKRRDNWILTPHPMEAARLLNKTVQEIQQDRVAAVTVLQQMYGGVVVLKGAGTLVAEAEHISMCEKGNPGMGTAGMGDILSGVLGGFLAQGFPSYAAAALGVYIHSVAGDHAAFDGERGMVATDLLPHLRRLANYGSID
jgi:NAD(P)H-hydrate epimerase